MWSLQTFNELTKVRGVWNSNTPTFVKLVFVKRKFPPSCHYNLFICWAPKCPILNTNCVQHSLLYTNLLSIMLQDMISKKIVLLQIYNGFEFLWGWHFFVRLRMTCMLCCFLSASHYWQWAGSVFICQPSSGAGLPAHQSHSSTPNCHV